MAALVLAFLGAALGAAQARPQQGKLDESVAELTDAARDESPLRVIITVAPGARQGIYAKLKAHGAKVNADFTIIEALAAELPPGLFRSLAKDKDVVAISTDAMVKGDGVTTSVTGRTSPGRMFGSVSGISWMSQPSTRGIVPSVTVAIALVGLPTRNVCCGPPAAL